MEDEQVSFSARAEELGLGSGWTWDKGSWWRAAEAGFEVRGYTAKMLQAGARFVTITATETKDGTMRFDYQWDLQGQLLSLSIEAVDGKIATITDLCPAADWVERETREYFAMEFTGRPSMEPLMLRAGNELGLHLRKEEKA